MTGPLRTLHVINGLGAGGSERSLAEILRGARDLGVDPHIACFYRRDEGVEHGLRADGFPIHYIDTSAARARGQALQQLASSLGAELVHTTHFEADLAGRLALRGGSTPLLSSLVSTPYAAARFRDPRVPRLKLAAVRAIDGWTGRRWGGHFHAVSAAVKDEAIQQTGFAPDRITVVERGRDPARLGARSSERRERARQRLGLERNQPVVVNVGRHEYAKGQRYLLDAVASLLPGHPSLALLIAGRDGAVSAELRARIEELELGPHVRLLGHCDDVGEVLAAADVFAFPSLYEGLPGALVEALALGLPVAASQIPGNLEVVEEGANALLSTPRNSAELADDMHRLLSDPELALEFGRRSRSIFDERFTLERSVERMVKLFRKCARRTAEGNE